MGAWVLQEASVAGREIQMEVPCRLVDPDDQASFAEGGIDYLEDIEHLEGFRKDRPQLYSWQTCRRPFFCHILVVFLIRLRAFAGDQDEEA